MARRKLTQQLLIDESGHEAIEEQYFWPVVRDWMPGGRELADQAVGQEQEAKQVLDQLDRLEAWDDGFEKLLREFISAVRDHVTFEETKACRLARGAEHAGDQRARLQPDEGQGAHPHRPRY